MPERDIDGSITAVVLAGGLGLRMGGRDKGLLPLQGRPLVAGLCDTLRPQVDQLVINANRNQAAYAALGWPVLADGRPGHPGPLAGIEAAMAVAPPGWLLCVPCDAARLPANLVAALAQGLRLAGVAAAYATLGAEPHYPVCLLSTALASAVRAALDRQQRSVRQLLAAAGAVPVDFAQSVPRPVFSLNDDDDWRAQGWTPP